MYQYYYSSSLLDIEGNKNHACQCIKLSYTTVKYTGPNTTFYLQYNQIILIDQSPHLTQLLAHSAGGHDNVRLVLVRHAHHLVGLVGKDGVLLGVVVTIDRVVHVLR